MRAVLALVGSAGHPSPVVPLLGVLGTDVEVVSWEAHRLGTRPPPDGVLAMGVEALAELPSVPTAVWVDELDELRAAVASGAATVLSRRKDLVDHGVVLVPEDGIDTDRWPPLAPVVRQRWRERFGLPSDLVIGLEPGAHLGDLPTDLALASVAVVTGPATVLALALATPVVTGPDTAARLGLRPGLDAEVVADLGQLGAVARALAADQDRAAAFSRRGRRFAERHLDLAHPARVLRSRLTLVPVRASGDPRSLVERRLDDLATPSASLLRRRVTAALEPFPDPLAGALL